MENLKVLIYGNEKVCGERTLLCSVDSNPSLEGSEIVSLFRKNIDNTIENNSLSQSQKIIFDKLEVLKLLGDRINKITEFDISCMRRIIDLIGEHPDFECIFGEYDNEFRNSYTDLVLIRNHDNRLMMKIYRDSDDNISTIYTSLSAFENKYNKFLEMIRYSNITNGEVIDSFEKVEKEVSPRLFSTTKNEDSDFQFRTMLWDIIPEENIRKSNTLNIECTLSKVDELISTTPLFRLEYRKLNGYYSVKGSKNVSVIENLLEENKLDKSIADKINDTINDSTVESIDDLMQDLYELVGFNKGMIFDIIPSEGPVVSIDSDEYYNTQYNFDEDIDEDDFYWEDEYSEHVEHESPKGIALIDDIDSPEFGELVGYAFQVEGVLYHRVSDSFIYDLERDDSTTKLGEDLEDINKQEFSSIYDFKLSVDEILADEKHRRYTQYRTRLEVLQDGADIRTFKKLMNIVLINKRNNMTVGKIVYRKTNDDNISINRSVTVNGYTTLDDDIRHVVRHAIMNQEYITKYDPVQLAEMIKHLVHGDAIELIIVKDGKAMYVDSNTRISWFTAEGIEYEPCDNTETYKGSDKKWYIDENNGFYDKTVLKKPEEDSKVNEDKLTFDDVVGMEQVKEKLYDVIDQFKNRGKYEKWGIKPIRGVLLHGPSGTGKSFISEALANEVNAHFIKKSSGDIMSKYVGQSGQNIKRIFDEAREKKGNTIIFIDEIDAIASKRTDEENKERNATLNELLVQMSSLENDNIFMIFATNLVELLDPAFVRSGRCDFKIEVPLPDFEMRKGILEKTSSKRPLSDDIDFDMISRNTSGMNCADIAHISNEAGRRAIKANKEKVEACDYEAAIEDMICGSNIKTTKLSEKEKTTTAYHEIGHFYMNYILDLRKAKKISILPRGSALGFVMYANDKEDDKFLYTKHELISQIETLLAGRAMEELFLDNISTGASDDLKKANKIARDIICKYGFNDSLLVLDENDIMSRNAINNQVKDLLNYCYTNVKEILKSEKDLLEKLSKYLFDKEDVTGDELIDYMNSIKNEN